MIQTIGQNPLAIRRLGHHAPRFLPNVIALEQEILYGWIGQDTDLHYLRQGRTGMNSWSLNLADGRVFHFRNGGDKTIVVQDTAYNGKQIATISTPDEARHFIRKLARTQKQLKLVV